MAKSYEEQVIENTIFILGKIKALKVRYEKSVDLNLYELIEIIESKIHEVEYVPIIKKLDIDDVIEIFPSSGKTKGYLVDMLFERIDTDNYNEDDIDSLTVTKRPKYSGEDKDRLYRETLGEDSPSWDKKDYGYYFNVNDEKFDEYSKQLLEPTFKISITNDYKRISFGEKEYRLTVKGKNDGLRGKLIVFLNGGKKKINAPFERKTTRQIVNILYSLDKAYTNEQDLFNKTKGNIYKIVEKTNAILNLLKIPLRIDGKNGKFWLSNNV